MMWHPKAPCLGKGADILDVAWNAMTWSVASIFWWGELCLPSVDLSEFSPLCKAWCLPILGHDLSRVRRMKPRNVFLGVCCDWW